MRPRGSVAAKMLRTAASLSGPGAIRPMRAAYRTALAAAALLAAGCMSPHGAVATDVNSASWSDPAPLTLANADTTTLRDVNLFLRCNDRFAEDSLTVRIRMRTVSESSANRSLQRRKRLTSRSVVVSALARVSGAGSLHDAELTSVATAPWGDMQPAARSAAAASAVR